MEEKHCKEVERSKGTPEGLRQSSTTPLNTPQGGGGLVRNKGDAKRWKSTARKEPWMKDAPVTR